MAQATKNVGITLTAKDNASPVLKQFGGEIVKVSSEVDRFVQHLERAEIAGDKSAISLNKMLAEHQLGKEAIKETAKETEKLVKEQDSLADAFTKVAKAVTGLFALKKITGFMQDAVEAATIQERAWLRMASQMKTGADATREQISTMTEYTEVLAQNTLFTDQQIQSMTGQLASGGLNVAQIEELIPLMLDWSTNLETVGGHTRDLDTLARTLTRGLAGGTAQMKSYYITFTEAEKALLKAADGEEKVVVMTEILTKRYGGLAEAMADLNSGELEEAKQQWTDVQEKLGDVILTMGKPWLEGISNLLTGANAARSTFIALFEALVLVEKGTLLLAANYIKVLGFIERSYYKTVMNVAKLADELTDAIGFETDALERFVIQQERNIEVNEATLDGLEEWLAGIEKLRAEQRASMLVGKDYEKLLNKLGGGFEEAGEAAESASDALGKFASDLGSIRDEIADIEGDLFELAKDYQEDKLKIEREFVDNVITIFTEAEKEKEDLEIERMDTIEEYRKKIEKKEKERRDAEMDYNRSMHALQQEFIFGMTEGNSDLVKSSLRGMAKEQDAWAEKQGKFTDDINKLEGEKDAEVNALAQRIEKKEKLLADFQKMQLGLEDKLSERREYLGKNELEQLVADHDEELEMLEERRSEEEDALEEKLSALNAERTAFERSLTAQERIFVETEIAKTKSLRKFVGEREDIVSGFTKYVSDEYAALLRRVNISFGGGTVPVSGASGGIRAQAVEWLKGQGYYSPSEGEIQSAMSEMGGAIGMASGGLVTRPTLAMLGESGPELVTPLRGSSAITVNITGNTFMSEEEAAEKIGDSILRVIRRDLKV